MAAPTVPLWLMTATAPFVRQEGPGGTQGMVGIVDSLAVWSKKAHPVLGGDARHRLLQLRSFLPRLAEPSGDDDCRFHSLFSTILNGLRHQAGRNDQNRQINTVRDLLHIPETS
jgi:hypothetical protein